MRWAKKNIRSHLYVVLRKRCCDLSSAEAYLDQNMPGEIWEEWECGIWEKWVSES